MTREEFLAAPLWSSLAGKHGWDEATLDRMLAAKAELDRALEGQHAPLHRESTLNRCLGRFLPAEGFTSEEVWRWQYASRWGKPALSPAPMIPERLSNFLVLFWMADVIQEVEVS
jgi:hypothetical protein